MNDATETVESSATRAVTAGDYQPPVRLTGQRMDAQERALAMAKFLEVFAETGYHGVACDAAGVQRSAIVYWRQHDAGFLAAYKEARKVADDKLRDELEDARKNGLREEEWARDPATGRMELVRRTHKQDARVMMGAAQARLEEYKPATKVELTGKDGGPVEVQGMSMEDAEAILRLARGARQLGLIGGEPEEGEFKEVSNG